MCLTVSNKTPSIAVRDIVGYKVYIDVNNRYMSPFQKEYMPKLKEITTTFLQESGSPLQTSGLFVIHEGFHSFEFLSDAMNLAIMLEEPIIAKCVIPEGSKYYKGKFNEFPSYCSESIIIKTIFKPIW